MNKKIKIFGIIILIVIIFMVIFLEKDGIEYIATVNNIINSETYLKNEYTVDYIDESFTIKIPKGLGDLELKGNVVFAFKSLKSVNKIKKEFEDLYGKENINVEGNKYYYKNPESNYIMSVRYAGGWFTDVNIFDIKTIENNKI